MPLSTYFVHTQIDVILFGYECRPLWMLLSPQVRTIRLVGMMLVVYVNKVHKNHIKEVAAEQVGTGIMGKMVRMSQVN